MCGIFGASDYSTLFGPADYDRFVGLTDLVGYRGPNASGYQGFSVLENPGSHQRHSDLPTFRPSGLLSRERFNVFFGHRRLSIIDLSDSANQPFTDDGQTWILFNGEIFNFVELRQELERKGHVFQTDGDTEVLLKVYKEFGEDGFDRLNGMWAFAIIDLQRKRLVLSRDRFSIKPLYLLQEGTRLYFSSEIKQLTPLLGTRRLNEAVMSTYMHQGLLDHNEETFFHGIRKLKAKHNLVIDFNTGSIVEKPYWDYRLTNGNGRMTMADAVEGFRHLFTDSVRIRLRSDVNIGALISGGLDSSAIAVVASQLQGGFHTYSAVSNDSRYSEESYIDTLCQEKRINNQKCRFQFDDAISLIDEVVYHNDEPVGGLSSVAHFQLMRRIKQETDVIVVLSGQGGDETLLGYLKFYFFTLKQFVKEGRLLRAGSEFFASLINGTCVRQFDLARAQRYLPAFLPFVNNVKLPPFLTLPVQAESSVWSFDTIVQRQMLDIDKFSVPALTHYEDRNSMAHSLEIRLPFLDHRLVEFVLSLPPEMKIRRGWTKYILRESLPELPDAIRWRKDKQWFTTPERQWLAHDLEPVFKQRFERSTLHNMGVIDDSRFLDQYRRFQNGDTGIPHAQISRVLMAELWARSVF